MKATAGLFAFLTMLILTANTQVSDAAVVCKYIGVPKGCVATPGVVLRAAPVVAPRVVAPTRRAVRRAVRRH